MRRILTIALSLIFVHVIVIAQQKMQTGHVLTAFRGNVADGYNYWLLTPPGTESVAVTDSTILQSEAEDQFVIPEDYDSESDDTTIFLIVDEPDTDGNYVGSFWSEETLELLDMNIAANTSDNFVESKPLVIFLHGASLKGTDLNKVLKYGTLDAAKMGLDLDAYVLAPQTQGSWSPGRIMKTVDKVLSQHPAIDPKRIYVIGMSLGGYGTIDLTATYPDRIAAAMAICGGGTVRDVSSLNEVPLWIVHGTADTAVSIGESDKVVEKMRSSNPETPRLIYTRVPGMNHSQPARLLYMPEVYQWLFSHTLSSPARTVSPGFEINNAVMNDVYSRLRRGKGVVKSTPSLPSD